jgi:colanic acid biosynthesis glycosyl transferase WcaI
VGVSLVRILLCGINYAPDCIGVAKYNTELCEWLRENGNDVRVVTAPPYYPGWSVPSAYRALSFRHDEIHGVSLTRAPIYVPRKPSGFARLLHHATFAFTSALPVIAQAREWRPHLTFSVAPSLMSAATIAAVARHVGARSWLHVQDLEVDAAFDLGLLSNRLLRGAMLAVEHRLLRAFDRVSTIAPEMRHRLEEKGVERWRLRDLPNWTDTSDITPGGRITDLRKELKLACSDVVALYAGTMSNKQGLDLIVETARIVAGSDPHVHFVLCGDGPDKARLQEIAKDLGNVQFIGLQTNGRLSQLLNTADMHLIPQRSEAADLVLPSKLGGILASGRPVITMATPGTGLAREVVGAGILVCPGDVAELAAAVRTLTRNADLRQRLGNAARERAVARWDKTRILRSLERELVELCGCAETGRLGAEKAFDIDYAASRFYPVRFFRHRRTRPL